METKTVFGCLDVRPQLCIRLTEVEQSCWTVIRGWLSEAWFMFTQCVLLALSATCFMYAAKSMGL